jgi:hypothetical protein
MFILFYFTCVFLERMIINLCLIKICWNVFWLVYNNLHISKNIYDWFSSYKCYTGKCIHGGALLSVCDWKMVLAVGKPPPSTCSSLHGKCYMQSLGWFKCNVVQRECIGTSCTYVAKRVLSTRSPQLFDRLFCSSWMCMTSNWRYFFM